MCYINDHRDPTSYPALKEAASLSPWSSSLLCSCSATSCEVAPTWCIISRDVCCMVLYITTSVVTSHLLATPSCLRAQQGAASSLQRGHTAVDRGHALAACKCRVSAVLLCRASNKAPTTGTSVCSSSPPAPHRRTPRSSCTWPPGRPPPPARPPAAARSAAAWHEDTVRDTRGITRLYLRVKNMKALFHVIPRATYSLPGHYHLLYLAISCSRSRLAPASQVARAASRGT